MSMMYKIFLAMLAAGSLGGVLFALWARLFGAFEQSFVLFVVLSAVVGVVYGFANYVFIKTVLRIFVRKFHALERVLVGTHPKPLPNVFLSNEIDEIEASAVRITDQFSKLSTSMGGASKTSGVGATKIAPPGSGGGSGP